MFYNSTHLSPSLNNTRT